MTRCITYEPFYFISRFDFSLEALSVMYMSEVKSRTPHNVALHGLKLWEIIYYVFTIESERRLQMSNQQICSKMSRLVRVIYPIVLIAADKPP